MSTPTLILPQSEANTIDHAELLALVSQISDLTKLDCIQRMSGGYSGAKLFIAMAELRGVPAPSPWIVKVGPSSEIQADYRGLILARSFIRTDFIISSIHYIDGDPHALLVLDYAAYRGKSPQTLESVLKGAEAEEAIASVVAMLGAWATTPTWKSTNISQFTKLRTATKWARMPDEVAATAQTATIFSPDFGESFSNPIYYLQRDMKRRDVKTPYAFVHGDLNLRNVLFSRRDDNSIQTDAPVLIDFSHANVEAPSLSDLARLEASLRYQSTRAPNDSNALSQIVAFLTASRASLSLRSLPEICVDKWIQMLWRSIKTIRQRVIALLGTESTASALVYWSLLIVEAMRLATYSSPSLVHQNLCYLDGAAIFTMHYQERVHGSPRQMTVHPTHSAPVLVTDVAQSASLSALPLLANSIARGQALLVVGPGYGRSTGTEPFNLFVQRLYKKSAGTEAPALPSKLLLEALQKKSPRPDILGRIREGTRGWSDASDRVFATAPWAALLNYHFHDMPYTSTSNAHREPARIDRLDVAAQTLDSIGSECVYVPLHGDTESLPDALVLTAADRRSMVELLRVLARALEQRQHSISMVFWRCEELSVDEMVEIRSSFVIDTAVSVDSYVISEINDNIRDAALGALDFSMIAVSMNEVIARLPALKDIVTARIEDNPTLWSKGGVTYRLPNVAAYSKGLLRMFSTGLVPQDVGRAPEAFLLGAPATVQDIVDGRVVRRKALEDQLMPAIHGALSDQTRVSRAVVVTGRAGSGISTLLCNAAYEIDQLGIGPVMVIDTSLARGSREWEDAGKMIAEISAISRSTVFLFAEATDQILSNLMDLLKLCSENRGRVLAIIGGRRDSLLFSVPVEARQLYYQRVVIGEQWSKAEWKSLARIVKRFGFRSGKSVDEVAMRMEEVGRLLPALLEATDGLNRKFKDIVAYEFGRYGRDVIIQKAYRLICNLGALDVPMSQFWLLKALGDRGVGEASRILEALSEDIVRYTEDQNDRGDIRIGPLHRIIAEEVIAVATPEPKERLRDIEQVVATANMANRTQGRAVGKLLYHKGLLSAWLGANIGSEEERDVQMKILYECALRNVPIHPQVEIVLRQHYAMHLRWHHSYPDALREARMALKIEPENSASIHIMALIHESRAIGSWYSYATSDSEVDFATARADENEALDFFRATRELRPRDEHGYESEARYYKKKNAAVLRSRSANLKSESRRQVFHGLYLLASAEVHVPRGERRDTAATKSHLLKIVGDLPNAVDGLRKEIHASDDVVSKVRLLRSLGVILMEGKQWSDANRVWVDLVKLGEHAATIYLALDDSNRETQASLVDRVTMFRDSAERYNRQDVETLVRWAELSLLSARYDAAASALARADENARDSMRIFERDRVRGVLESAGGKIRFTGKVRRLLRADEGYVSLGGHRQDVWYRGVSGLDIGDAVSFSLAWRVRGLQAVDIIVVDASGRAKRSRTA